MILAALPNPTAGANLDWLQSAVIATIAAAAVTGLFALIQAVGNKKLRSPADRLAEVSFYVDLAKQQVAEAREDRKEMEAATRELRAYVETLEAAGRTDAQSMREAEAQITKLHRTVDSLQRRIDRKARLATALQGTIDAVAEKLLADQPITLADLTPAGFRPVQYLDTGELELVG